MKSNISLSAVIIITALLVGAHEYFHVTKLFDVHLPVFLKNETQSIAIQLGDSLTERSDLSSNDIPLKVFPSISVRIEIKRTGQVRNIPSTNAHLAPPQWFINLFMKKPVEYQMFFYNENEKRATIYTSMMPNALLRDVWFSYLKGIVLFGVVYLVCMSLYRKKEQFTRQLADRIFEVIEQVNKGSYQYKNNEHEHPFINRIMSELHNMLETNRQRIKALEKEKDKYQVLTEHDELTGLANKQCFHNVMKKKLRVRDGKGGHLLLLKLASLEQINIQLGHKEGDIYISRMANVLNKLCNFKSVTGHVFRNLGSEMLVVIENADDTTIDFLAEELKGYLDKLENEAYQNGCGYFSIIAFKPGQKLSELMMLLDCNLSQAMVKFHNAYIIAQPQEMATNGLNQWYKTIDEVLRRKNVKLHRQLVESTTNIRQSYQYEIYASFYLDNEMLDAVDVFSAAKRFNLSYKLDQLVMTKVIEYMDNDKEHASYCIKITSCSVTNEIFRSWISHLLSHHLNLARCLVFEIPEVVIVESLDDARIFINAVHKVGARISLDYQQYSDVGELTELIKSLTIDMVKFNGTDDQQKVNGNNSFINVLVDKAHSINVPVIAGQVESSQAWDSLSSIGIDAGQGHFFGKPVIVA